MPGILSLRGTDPLKAKAKTGGLCQLAPSRKARGARTPRRSRAFLAALRRQCRLANEADRRDNWQQYIHLPE